MRKEKRDAALVKNVGRERSLVKPKIGSPQRWLTVVGTLSAQEADKLLALTEDFEQVEAKD